MRVRSLWQRLALWYIVTTMVISGALDLATRIGDYWMFRRTLTTPAMTDWASAAAADIAPALVRADPDPRELRAWLDRVRERFQEKRFIWLSGFEFHFRESSRQYLGLQLFDAKGRLLATSAPAVETVSAGDGAGLVQVTVPVRVNGAVGGVLRVRLVSPFDWQDFWQQTTTEYFGGIGVIFTIIVIFGLMFGAVTAVRLTRRLKRIASAADGWSRGDFSHKADDNSADELGRLALRLNQMSEELRGVMRMRQDLATLEERQRIARDLHDAVKQQVFALEMHIAAARSMTSRDPALLSTRLADAAALLRRIQRELGGLLHQLEPVTHQGGEMRDSLSAAIYAHAEAWSSTYDIRASVQGRLDPEPPPAIARDLLLIVEEAMTNIARHSGARTVRIELSSAGDITSIAVADDGRQFDPEGTFAGRGLRNMRARAASLPDGRLEIRPERSRGMRVAVTCAHAMPATAALGRVGEDSA